MAFRRFAEATMTDAEEVDEELQALVAAVPRQTPSPPVEVAREESLNWMTAEAAHDFNNLLAVIVACAYELENGAAGGQQVERAAEIRSAAEQCMSLTRRMSEESGGPGVEPPVPTELDAVIRNARGMICSAMGKRVEVNLELASGLPRAPIGRERIEQILLNLASNARDAMHGIGALTIRTGLAMIAPGDDRLGPGWYVQLEVCDDGPGMSPQVRSRALEAFFTTKRGAGTGLGLATVARVAAGAGGDVRIESTVGIGTTISVLLPAVGPSGQPLALRGLSAR